MAKSFLDKTNIKYFYFEPFPLVASWSWAATVDVGWPWVPCCIIMHEARSREL